MGDVTRESAHSTKVANEALPMPAFSAEDQSVFIEEAVDTGQMTALLDQGANFEGRLTFEGTVRIGGGFKGEIFTQDTLVINAGAKVEAQIEADIVIISGHMTGNVFARRRVIMHPPAVFKGTVTSPSLRIDEGVMFEGASYMPKT